MWRKGTSNLLQKTIGEALEPKQRGGRKTQNSVLYRRVRLPSHGVHKGSLKGGGKIEGGTVGLI